MSESRLAKLDPFTIPTAITLGRLMMSRHMAKRLGRDPTGTWKSTALFVGSDVIDGFLAKTGDWLGEHFEALQFIPRMGFRKSEFGRLSDPITDKPVIGQMVWEGMKQNIIPGYLAKPLLAQKAGVSALSAYSFARGADPHVTDRGRHSEFLINVGVGMLFPAEGIQDPQTRSIARAACIATAFTGLAGALTADVGYAKATHEQLAQR